MSPSRQKRDRYRERQTRVRALLRPKFGDQLLAVWRDACRVFEELCDRFATPRALADREWIDRAEYREIEGWVASIEMLTRRLLFTVALGLDIVLKPIRDIARAARERRYRLAWPARPETWRAFFPMFRGRGRDIDDMDDNDDLACAPDARTSFAAFQRVLPSFPLARRLEALRRVLLGADKRAHRLAIRLARLKISNQTAAKPRLFAVPEWRPAKYTSRGMLLVSDSMAIVTPVARERVASWNPHTHPG